MRGVVIVVVEEDVLSTFGLQGFLRSLTRDSEVGPFATIKLLQRTQFVVDSAIPEDCQPRMN